MKEVENYFTEGALPVPVLQKSLEMADGVVLSVKIVTLPLGRVTLFYAHDLDFVCESVLSELFLYLGGAVCAYSFRDGVCGIKLFLPFI